MPSTSWHRMGHSSSFKRCLCRSQRSVCLDGGDLESLISTPDDVIELHVDCDDEVDCHIGVGEPKTQAWLSLLYQLLLAYGRSDSIAFAIHGHLWESIEMPSIVQQTVRTQIQAASLLLDEAQVQGAAAALAELFGLGAGTMSAGDAFLLGVLAACHYQPTKTTTALMDELRRQLPPRVDDQIAMAFLQRSFAGETSQVVRDVLKVSSGRELMSAVGRCVQYGHSSGVDTLGGLCWMLGLESNEPLSDR